MTDVWLSLSERERLLIHEALAAYRGAEGANPSEVAKFARKLARATPHPDITIGVYGGQVQWTSGNPFPIRVVDYDGDRADLTDRDESGEPCRAWFEPSDRERRVNLRKRA